MNGLLLYMNFGNLIYFLSNVYSPIHVNNVLAVHIV